MEKRPTEKQLIAITLISAIIATVYIVAAAITNGFSFLNVMLVSGIILMGIATTAWICIRRKSKGGLLICIVIIGLIMSIAISSAITFSTAIKHGMYKTDTPIAAMLKCNEKTPVESELPDDISGKLIIYYRYDCPDCHDTYDEMRKMCEAANVDPLWVSTRSQQGKKLMEDYPPTEVPAGLFIENTSNNNKNEYNIEVLAKSSGESGDDNNKTRQPSELNRAKFEKLINYAKKES